MSRVIQLDFFKSDLECEMESITRKVEEVIASNHKVRKKCFAEIGRYAKLVDDLSERLNIIERNICRPSSEF